MNDTIERYKQRQTLYKEKKSNLQDLYTKKEEVQDEIKQLEDRSDILNKSIETVKKLIDVLFNSKIEAFEELIQEGLNQIFIDREYQFDINLGSRGSKKTAEFQYKRKEGEWQKMDDSCGGSVRVVSDLICRIYLISQLEGKRFLMMDEALSELSDEYIEPCIQFIKGLSSKMDFDILLVSHDGRITEHVDQVFYMNKGEIVQ